MKILKPIVLSTLLFLSFFVYAQNAPKIILAPPMEARVHFEKTHQDLGKIEEGLVKSITFLFINSGEVPLIISKVKASCDCTVASFAQTPVAPGETGEIVIRYDSKKRAGKFIQTVSVVYNSDQSPELLTIEGEVIPNKKKYRN